MPGALSAASARRSAEGGGNGHYFARFYSGTGVEVWITHGVVEFETVLGGHEEYAGQESMWQRGVPRVACSRAGAGLLEILR